MKLFLFGGAESELGQVPILMNQIKAVIQSVNPKSVLQIPYARFNLQDKDWPVGWFKNFMDGSGIEILDASVEGDLDKASESMVFINGGSGKTELMDAFNTNPVLKNLVLNAKYVVAESAGALVFGQYLRASRESDLLIPGLGVLKDTIIEAHYSERHREQLLLDEMKMIKAKYGIGIDCATGASFDLASFPDKFEKIGSGKVDVIIN
jgi:hypothetical protein